MKLYTANNDIKLFEHLIDNDKQTVTHLSFDKDQELGTHTNPWTVIVVIYKGKVEFTGENGTEIIEPGDIIEMQPNEKHSLKALEESDLMVIKSKLA